MRGLGCIWELSVLSAQFFCKPKTVLKKKSIDYFKIYLLCINLLFINVPKYIFIICKLYQ